MVLNPGLLYICISVGTLIQIMPQKVLLPVLHSFITDYLRLVLVQDQEHKLSQRRVSYQPDISRFTETRGVQLSRSSTRRSSGSRSFTHVELDGTRERVEQ